MTTTLLLWRSHGFFRENISGMKCVASLDTTKKEHFCDRPHGKCFQKECKKKKGAFPCNECHQTYRLSLCYKLHKEWKAYRAKEKTICQAYKNCPACYCLINPSDGRRYSLPHQCYAVFCRNRQNFVQGNNFCCILCGESALNFEKQKEKSNEGISLENRLLTRFSKNEPKSQWTKHQSFWRKNLCLPFHVDSIRIATTTQTWSLGWAWTTTLLAWLSAAEIAPTGCFFGSSNSLRTAHFWVTMDVATTTISYHVLWKVRVISRRSFKTNRISGCWLCQE